jgi:hypothetical protein
MTQSYTPGVAIGDSTVLDTDDTEIVHLSGREYLGDDATEERTADYLPCEWGCHCVAFTRITFFLEPASQQSGGRFKSFAPRVETLERL